LQAELEARNDLFLQHEMVEFVDSAQALAGQPLGGRSAGRDLRDEARVHEETGLFVVIQHKGVIHSLPDKLETRRFAEALGAADLDVTPRTIRPVGAPFGIRAVRRILKFPESGTWTLDLCLTLDETVRTVANFRRRLAEGGDGISGGRRPWRDGC